MKPHLLLVNPAINLKTQNRVLTDIIRISFPMSLGHLAGYLEGVGGHAVRIHDEQILPLTDIQIEEQLARLTPPKIIGFTTLTITSSRVYELAARFKAVDPRVTIVIGGIHPTVLPDEGLASGGVDFVVVGEGEETLAELLAARLNDRDPATIPGLCYRDGDGGCVRTSPRGLIADLDSLPPFPYHLFEPYKEDYSGFFSIQTSRGCPYRCIFCSQRSLTGRTYRYVSPSRALRDIQHLVDKYGATTIRILDDNIAAHKGRLLELLDAIINSGVHRKTSFEAPMRGDHLDAHILAKLKEANFSLITFGLETASDRLMGLINKGEKVQDVVRAIEMTAQAGITVGTTLIFGLPTETNQDRWNTIRLVNSLPLDSARYNILTPYPGTPVYEQILLRGEKIDIHPGWLNFSVQYMWENDDIPYVPTGTDKYELIFTTMLANLWFYLRPRGWLKMLTKSVAGGNVVLLPSRWFFTRYLLKMVRVGTYLTRRFVRVWGKLLYSRLAPTPKPSLQECQRRKRDD